MIHLLVVDDDKDILKFVKMLLETRDYMVTTCLDAQDALDKLQHQPFDILLSDANMPGGSGFDLIKTVRHQERFHELGVAMLTGRRERKDVEKALESGADDYIVKPIDPDLLFHKLDTLLKKRPPTQRPDVQFAATEVRYDIQVSAHAQVDSISEVGMTFVGPVFFENFTKLGFQTRIFDEIGIKVPVMKVQKTEPIDVDGSELFKTHVSFIGLAESDQQKLRGWMNQNIIHRNKKVA